MTEPYLGQVKVLSFNFAPKGYAFCSGALMAITQNAALFSLLGTTYGGDGVRTFGLPDLRGRTPLGQSPEYPQGMVSGTEGVTLLSTQLPSHGHPVQYASQSGSARNPATAMYGNTGASPLYAPGTNPPVMLNPLTVGMTGGNAPHENMQPFTVLNFCVALAGIFPSRS